MEITAIFREQVTEAWGDPLRVADAALNELFRHGDAIDLDYDDQVEYAMRVGILVGELKKTGTLENFIQRFEAEILNE